MKSTAILLSTVAGAVITALAGCVVPQAGSGTGWTFDDGAAVAEPWMWGNPNAGQAADPNARFPGETSPAPTRGGGGAGPPLYSFNGDVVDGPERGSVVETPRPGHDLGNPDGGALHIIELYQMVLDERDDLAEEVARLSAALEKTYGLLDQSEQSGTTQAARIAAAEAELDRLRKENEDLGARLTTAQIRRLEAEKMLLEIQIEAFRLRESEGAVGSLDRGSRGDRLAMGDGR